MDDTISRIILGIFSVFVIMISISIYRSSPDDIPDELITISADDYYISDYRTFEFVRAEIVEIEEDKLKQYTIYDVPLDQEVQIYIVDKCESSSLSPDIVTSLIKHESTFRPDVISGTNDYGLMQINKSNHSWISNELGISDFLDPYENIDAGMYILGGLMGKYNNIHLALMAYNMGEGKAAQHWKNGTYSSKYSRKIVEYAEELKNNEIIIEVDNEG